MSKHHCKNHSCPSEQEEIIDRIIRRCCGERPELLPEEELPIEDIGRCCAYECICKCICRPIRNGGRVAPIFDERFDDRVAPTGVRRRRNDCDCGCGCKCR